MTWLKNEATNFAADSIRGFVAANEKYIVAYPGGVIRSTVSAKPEVAVVVGGGLGHYPAFGGFVGPGLAHGAVLGNIFASPSARQVVSIARAADQGRGVILLYGNYSGDALAFEEAKRQLEESGISTRSLAISDEILSAPKAERSRRRGVAGDLVVFKIAGAAALAGMDLDSVFEVVRRANESVATLGVAFSGCTLPGAESPLFTVTSGKMAVGLGLHGEPGLDEVDLPTPLELSELLVSGLLADLDHEPIGRTVVPILNGLGAFKYEELYVLFGHIEEALARAGVTMLDPQVGEFFTSFDMAGLSLSLFWPDTQLESLWLAPADSVGFRSQVPGKRAPASRLAPPETVYPSETLSESSITQAKLTVRILHSVSDRIEAEAAELGRIDSIAGDGDHGIGMQRGSAAAAAASAQAAEMQSVSAGRVLRIAADAWADAAGGASGALWGMILRTIGESFEQDGSANRHSIVRGLASAHAAVTAAGGAAVGDKTMVDALAPFAEEIARGVTAGLDVPAAWAGATDIAEAAAQETANFVARRGRSATHGETSLGVCDPGALSFAIIMRTVCESLQKGE